MANRPLPREALRVMLVDPSRVAAERTTQLIEQVDGVRVVRQCAQVVPAIAALRAQPCDLVVVDMALDGGSGLEVLREPTVHADGRHFVCMTSFVSEPHAKEARRLGARAVLDKTRGLGELLSIVRRLKSARAAPRP